MKHFILKVSLFLHLTTQAAETNSDYHRNYSWGKIKSSSGTCLQEYYGKLQFRTCVDSNEQQWTMTHRGQLRHRVKNSGVGSKCIDIPDEKKNNLNQAALQMYTCNESPTMQWRFIPADFNPATKEFQLNSRWPDALPYCMSNPGDNQNVIISLCAMSDSKQAITLDPLDNNHIYDVFPNAAVDMYKVDKANWMLHLYRKNPFTLLNHIFIPGTHNSATYRGFYVSATTQERSILQQLNDGIRYLDLRIDVRKSEPIIVHGIANGPADSLISTFKQIRSFAQTHPKEIIIVDLQEIPLLNNDNDHDGVKNITLLYDELKAYFSDIAYTHNEGEWPQYLKKLWDAKRNVILIATDFQNIKKAISDPALVWERKEVLHSKWPNARDFNVIGTELVADLKYSYSHLHVSQLIRTPSTWDTIGTVLSFKEGPKGLTLELTDDGYFNHSISKWLNMWVVRDKLHPNIVITDFYHESNLVAMTIRLNIRHLYEK